MSRAAALFSSIVIVAIAAPSPSVAATLSLEGTGPSRYVLFQAAAGEVNHPWVTVAAPNDPISVDDFYGPTLAAGKGCTRADPSTETNVVTCPSASYVRLELGDRDDSVQQGSSKVPIRIYGGEGNDVIWGGDMADTFDGGAGDDEMYDQAGSDTFTGGTGSDTLVTPYGSPTTATLGGTATHSDNGDVDVVGADIENLTGSVAADHLTGDNGPNRLDDGGGVGDVLNGLGGDDQLKSVGTGWAPTPAGGGDVVDGGDGNDVIDGEAFAAVHWSGGAGNDTLTSHGDAWQYPFSTYGVIDGGDGVDSFSHSLNWLIPSETPGVRISLDGVANDGDTWSEGTANVLPTIENLAGTENRDILVGSSGDNVIESRGGLDDVSGGGGTDTVSYAGVTTDLFISLDGVWDPRELDNLAADIENVTGGSGNDTFVDPVGPTRFDGGAGNDSVDYSLHTHSVVADLDGALGDDGESGEGDSLVSIENLTGGAGNDVLTGNDSDNVLDGGLGDDVLTGLGGTDTVTYASRTADVWASINGAADDGEETEFDDIDVENVIGGAGNDLIVGDAVANNLRGGLGNDLLAGGPGDDKLDGGGGNDLVSYADHTEGVTVDLGNGNVGGSAGEADTLASFEALEGGSGPDALRGDAGGNSIFGGAGNDIIDGRDGANWIEGGPGNDQISSGWGDDVLWGGDGRDSLTASAGADWLEGGADDDALRGGENDDTLRGGPGTDVLDGGPGIDWATYSERTTPVDVQLGGTGGAPGEADVLQPSVEGVVGGEGDDVLRGDGEMNGLEGLGGNDAIDPGPNFDWIWGDAGDDRMTLRDNFEDTAECGEGTDSVLADEGDALGPDCETVSFSDPLAAVVTPETPAINPPAQEVLAERQGDHVPPRLSLSVATARLATFLKRGVMVRVRSNEPAALQLKLLRAKKTVASARINVAPNRTAVVHLRPRAAIARTLRKARLLKLSLRLQATDGAANRSTVVRKVTVRR